MRNLFLESADIPTYFRCKHVAYPAMSTPRPPRSLSPLLRDSESADAPFCLPLVPVLDSTARNSEYAKRSKSPGRFLNELKVNTPIYHSPFNYEDQSSQGPDLASVLPSQVLDAVADSGLRLRSKSPFAARYHKQLERSGFGAQRGLFTVEANTPRIERTSLARLGALKKSTQRGSRRETPILARPWPSPPRCRPEKPAFLPDIEVSVATQLAEFEQKLLVERMLSTKGRREAYLR